LMLIFVGFQLNQVRWRTMGAAAVGALCRLGGGLLVSLAAAAMLGLSGTVRDVAILLSITPTAINTYFFARYFDTDVTFAGTMIFITTLASFVVIPLCVFLLR